MADKPKNTAIEVSDLLAKLHEVSNQCDGDIARIIELLLLENHMLGLGQSSGLRRGVQCDFSNFPKFLALSNDSTEDHPSRKLGSQLNEPAPD